MFRCQGRWHGLTFLACGAVLITPSLHHSVSLWPFLVQQPYFALVGRGLSPLEGRVLVQDFVEAQANPTNEAAQNAKIKV
jgi:hypothetical protein